MNNNDLQPFDEWLDEEIKRAELAAHRALTRDEVFAAIVQVRTLKLVKAQLEG